MTGDEPNKLLGNAILLPLDEMPKVHPRFSQPFLVRRCRSRTDLRGFVLLSRRVPAALDSDIVLSNKRQIFVLEHG